MFLLASVTSKNIRQLRRRWKAEGGFARVVGQRVFNSEQGDAGSTDGASKADAPVQNCWKKDGYVLPTSDSIESIIQNTVDIAGSLILIDFRNKQIVWESEWTPMIATPHGFCVANRALIVNDLEAAHVFEIPLDNPRAITRRFSNPAFNDLHSIVPTSRGFLVTSTGADCILEVDNFGKSIWEWWASEHGFDLSASGERRQSGRGRELRDKGIHTRFQTTHVNSAAIAGPDEQYVLATLFHQGAFVLIDRRKPIAAQRAEIIISGLARPHGPRPHNDGWMVCNSLGQEILIFNSDLCLSERVPYLGGWIQDATLLSDGRIALNDVDNHRIVLLSTKTRRETDIFDYDSKWRAGQLLEIDYSVARKFIEARDPGSKGIL